MAHARFTVRDYRPEDAEAWLRTWAQVAVTSHAWFFLYQVRPAYARPAVLLVAEADGHLVGFLDIELENSPGELCYREDEPGGFAWEFGVLPQFRRRGIGRALVEEGARRVARAGRRHVEYWSMDQEAWAFYRAMGMHELERHYQFFFRPTPEVKEALAAAGVRVQFLYGTCSPDRWEDIRARFALIRDRYMDAHLCIGFDHRF